MSRDEVEDGMGFAGLAPTAEERRNDAYEDARRKIAHDAADVDDGTPNFAMRILVIAQAALLPSKGTTP